MVGHPKSAAFAHAIIMLAGNIGLEVVAEAMLSTLAYSPCEPYGKRVKWRSLSH